MKPLFIILAIFVVGATCRHASAEMLMTLWGEPDSSIVNFELSGSDMAKGDFDTLIGSVGIGFQITDGYDPFPKGMWYSMPLLSGGATITNGPQTRPIAGIWLQDSRTTSRGVDRFGVNNTRALPPTGHFGWEGAGTFELPNRRVFGDLNPGTGIGQWYMPPFPGAPEVPVLEGRLTIVPEPASFTLLLFAIPLLRRRCRTLLAD